MTRVGRRVYRLPEVAFFQEGPGLRTHQWAPEGMKVINVSNIMTNGSIDISNTDKYISSNEFDLRYQHFAIEENDIVVASSGNTYGKVGRIRAEHLPIMMNTSVIRFHSADRTLLDDDYLFAFLRSPEFRKQIEGFVTGGAQPNFGPSHLKQMNIILPSLDAQQKIASILSAYDGHIENNRRRIQLLEESARLLYREWFVYLRFPGHEHVNVVDGVPEGWERKKIVDICETVGGGTPSTSVPDYWDGDITWVVPTDITKNDCLVLLDSERKITEKGLRESSARLVPPNTILMTSRASVGFFALIDREVCTRGSLALSPTMNRHVCTSCSI